MKNKTVILIFSLIAFVSICFTACENLIISKWWEDEPDYIPLTKKVGYYDSIIKVKIVYKTIFQSLPPETITKYIYVYEQLPPEIIYQVVTETKTEYVYVYNTVIQYVPTPAPPPTKDEIIKWLKETATEDNIIEITNIIKEKIPEVVIKNIINNIPPEEIIKYLTDEQIQYIVSQQPAQSQKILQSIRIIGIEYIIFAGDSSIYNGPHGPSANTSLTAEEISYNDTTVKAMAKLMVENPTYIAMLHGHANPVTFTDGEKGDLIKLSNDRANAVRQVLLTEYNKVPPIPTNPPNPPFNDRVSTSGYGGEKVLFGNNTTYTALNRRVELILFDIVTTVTP
jgi:Outer membrane protein and related peptidoglycan-associated (lipo)proteins